MLPSNKKQETTDEKIKRLTEEFALEDSAQRRRYVLPTFPSPTDTTAGVLHRYPPLVWWPPLVPALVALFASPAVLDQWPALMRFCNTMIQWFPFLGGHAKVSSMPQVISLVKCLSFALLLPQTIATFVTFWPRRHAYADARIRAGRISPPPLQEVAFVFVALVLTFATWIIPHDPSWCRGCSTNSRFVLATLDWAGTFGVPLAIVGVVFTLHVRAAVASGRTIGEIAMSAPGRKR